MRTRCSGECRCEDGRAGVWWVGAWRAGRSASWWCAVTGPGDEPVGAPVEEYPVPVPVVLELDDAQLALMLLALHWRMEEMAYQLPTGGVSPLERRNLALLLEKMAGFLRASGRWTGDQPAG